MKANELRIGNYVNVPNKNQCPFRIDEIEYLGDTSRKFSMVRGEDAHPATWYLIDIEPIQLTEDWLVRAGFKKSGNGLNAVFHKKTIEFVSHPFDDGYYMRNFQRKVHTKYVHQLQNLYFALTGEELTIKS